MFAAARTTKKTAVVKNEGTIQMIYQLQKRVKQERKKEREKGRKYRRGKVQKAAKGNKKQVLQVVQDNGDGQRTSGYVLIL